MNAEKDLGPIKDKNTITVLDAEVQPMDPDTQSQSQIDQVPLALQTTQHEPVAHITVTPQQHPVPQVLAGIYTEDYTPRVREISIQGHDNIDLEDDQRGPEDPLNAHAYGPLSAASVRQWRVLFSFNGDTFASGLHYSKTEPWTSVAFRLPDNQRASMALRLNLPRNMDKAINPARFGSHCMHIIIHACRVTVFEYVEVAIGGKVPGFNTETPQFLDRDGTPYPIAMMTVQSTSTQVAGGRVPPLITEELDDQVARLIQAVRNESGLYNFQFLVRANDPLVQAMAVAFQEASLTEQTHDPAKDWIRNSPNAEAFQMGNLVDDYHRPNIDLQQAQTVFLDKMDHLIPHIYGNYIEEEYQQKIIQQLEADRFEMRLMESPIASNPDDGTPTSDTYESSARAYFAFVDFSDKELIRPEVGTPMRVTLLDYAGANDKDTSTDEDSSSDEESSDQNNGEGAADELGNEDEHGVFELEREDINTAKPNEWAATVIDPTAVTPPGCLTLMLERCRDPYYEDHRYERPFVSFTLPTVNFRIATSEEDLAERLQAAPTVRVAIKMTYSRQGFVDQVNCADDLWRGTTAQKTRIRAALLCHNPDNSPLEYVNLLELKGTSTLDLTTSFNTAQKAAYNSLGRTPEITLIHGPFGTGKTTLNIAHALEIISNPEVKNTALLLVDSNAAVDDIALRMRTRANALGMEAKVILRAHTLKAEKREVYRYFDPQGKPQKRFQVSDEFVAEFATLGLLNKLDMDYKATRARGDPRRVLVEMSVAQAMFNKLDNAETGPLVGLRCLLRDHGDNGFYDTDVATRTNIKLQLDDLMARTLQEADVIVCTVAAAAKVTLAENFHPTVVYLDEAARVTELKTLIPFGRYTPFAFILSGDHKQLRPTVLSANRQPEFLNPFQNQVLLSLFERLIAAGQEHMMLKIQHRCMGEIPGWVSKRFYHNQVKRAPLLPAKETILDIIRSFVREQLGVPRPTNRYAVDLSGARSQRENGGTSSYNEHEIQHIMNDLCRIRAHPVLQGMTVGILSFYKAQITRFKTECYNLRGVTVVDGNEHLSTVTAKTVDSAQGAEFDIVSLSLVRTTRPAFLAEPHRLVVSLTRAKWMLGIYTSWSLVQGRYSRGKDRHLVSLFEDLILSRHVATRMFREITCLRCQQKGHVARDCARNAF
ncbi:hypothetical protein OIDMADRAFT_58618 [Oidiodendron maius Zn]|uniref:CCHC-type domain-containing protein n=1 Tax=Oidiodendron maius (strain Zn) TaxID=913774 RepID=A0A0C3H192_OIDMZ|nr:hypothetical protein OIDMADRAFT_58618 [Oidiodendron maius Zn]